MFRNFINTTIRFLLRNKTFSIINLAGLAAGTICCLYMVLYVMDQYSYDKHHRHADNIYRLTTQLQLTGDKHNMATASPPIAPAMREEFPEVEQFTRVIPVMSGGHQLLHYNGKSIYEEGPFLVDSTFFDIFSYHFVSGTATTAMANPNSIVLSSEVAKKLFGKEDPAGKLIELENGWGREPLTVTGVIDESLGQSHIRAPFFISLSGYGNEIRDNSVWSGNNFTYSYLRLKPGSSALLLESKFPAFLQKHAAQDLKNRGMQKQQHLQPITEVHTTGGYEVEAGKIVSASFLKLLLLVAILIQVIACINFMNLSTARASKRAKEVGVRKVAGAGRSNLVLQFLLESFSLALIGVLIAVPLLVMAMPWLNQITEANITAASLMQPRVWLALIGLVFFTGLLAGSYPAFYLPAFDVIRVIKGNFKNQISAAGIRKFLVVFQFTLSLILIISIIVIYNQLHYIRNRDLGFDSGQKLVFRFHTPEMKKQIPAFMNELNQLAEVKATTLSSGIPGQPTYFNWGVFLSGGDLSTSVNQENISTDNNFIKTMGIHMLSGRDFSPQDSGRVIINETLARRLGLTAESAIGKRLYTEDVRRNYEITGVMKDFNYQSLHEAISPFMLIYNPKLPSAGNVVASVNSSDYAAFLDKIKVIWQKHIPGLPFDYRFMDAQVEQQYKAEATLARIINAFTGMAILISCLGLFGLAAFSAEQRTREIAVRKVLGAGLPSLVKLLSGHFIKLVAIAFVVAVPVGWYVMDQWLQSFVYRVELSWWVFALAGGIALLIAVLTVSSQAIRVALGNPVKSLRSE